MSNLKILLMESRGIRNCNPGNIRINSESFVGEVKPSIDADFKTFKSITYGVRAIMRILLTYYRKYNCDTVAKVINRYASIENDTKSYIAFVCKHMHTESNTVLRLDITSDLFPLVEAICIQETAYHPTKTVLIDAFLKL